MTKETFKKATILVEELKELREICKLLSGPNNGVSLSLIIKAGENQVHEPISEELSARFIDKTKDIREELEKAFESL